MKTFQIIAGIFIFLFSGCATKPVPSFSDSNVHRAAIISDRIEDKAVVVQRFLQTH